MTPAPARFQVGDIVWGIHGHSFGQVLGLWGWRGDYGWRYDVLEKDGLKYTYFEDELRRTIVSFVGPVRVEMNDG